MLKTVVPLHSFVLEKTCDEFYFSGCFKRTAFISKRHFCSIINIFTVNISLIKVLFSFKKQSIFNCYFQADFFLKSDSPCGKVDSTLLI